jgi:hypothetical protein
MAAGAKLFPAAPDSKLPGVLKALHLQRTFTRFVIDNQLLAVDPAPAPQLYAAFRDFVTVNQSDNAPQGAVRTDRPWSDYIRWGYGLHG